VPDPVVLDVMGLTPFLFDVSWHLLLLLLRPSFCVVSVHLPLVPCPGLSSFFWHCPCCSLVIWSHFVLPFYFAMLYCVTLLACTLAGICLHFHVMCRGFFLSSLQVCYTPPHIPAGIHPEFLDSGCHFFWCIYHCERVILGQSNLLFLPRFPGIYLNFEQLN